MKIKYHALPYPLPPAVKAELVFAGHHALEMKELYLEGSDRHKAATKEITQIIERLRRTIGVPVERDEVELVGDA